MAKMPTWRTRDEIRPTAELMGCEHDHHVHQFPYAQNGTRLPPLDTKGTFTSAPVADPA